MRESEGHGEREIWTGAWRERDGWRKREFFNSGVYLA